MKNDIWHDSWLGLVSINMYSKYYPNILKRSRDRTSSTFIRIWTSTKPPSMINIIWLFHGLLFVKIIMHANFYQNIYMVKMTFVNPLGYWVLVNTDNLAKLYRNKAYSSRVKASEIFQEFGSMCMQTFIKILARFLIKGQFLLIIFRILTLAKHCIVRKITCDKILGWSLSI